MTHDEYAKRLAAAVEAFCVAHPWARRHQAETWVEPIGDAAGNFGFLLHRHLAPDGLDDFVKAWLAANPVPTLTWRPARDANTNEILDADKIGDLFDEDVWVGHARYLEHGPPSIEPDQLRVWNWSVFPFPGFWRGHTVTMGGRERSKDEAKAAAEATYRTICEIPGARDANLKHSRELMEMRAAGRAKMAAGGVALPVALTENPVDHDDAETFYGAFDPPRD